MWSNRQVQNDPEETHDLAGKPELAAVVKELAGRLERLPKPAPTIISGK